MNSQFHTPSLGDGFDLSGVEEAATNLIDLQADSQTVFQQPQVNHFESKRVQGMEQSVSLANPTIVDANNYSVGNTNIGSGISNTGTSGIFNITAHLNNNATNNLSHGPPTMAARKQLSPCANDPNEPAKPLSPYTLFFRDRVSAIKQQNPNCAFADITLIVSSLWEALEADQKEIYNKKAEAARNEYLKQLKIYKQQNLRSDGQSAIMMSNDNSNERQFINANSCNQESLSPEKQSQMTTCSTENLMSPPQMPMQTTTNALGEESTMNSQSSSNTQHTHATSQTPIPTVTPNTELCIRDGCNKRAIMNLDWEDEYCSNECVVIHCRNVFNDWVKQNREVASLQQ